LFVYAELMGKIMLEVLAKYSDLVPVPVLQHHSELGHQAWEDIPDPPAQATSEPCRLCFQDCQGKE